MSDELFKELIDEANKLTDKDILIIDLERQLDEAREEEIKFLNALYIYEQNMSTISEIRYRILQLKEKGDE